MTEAPDYVEPFEAWRAWKVVKRGREFALASVVQRILWPAEEGLRAECLRGMFRRFRRRRTHGAPHAECECGIYGAGLDAVRPYLSSTPGGSDSLVVGKVALWGTVIECERGFRASDAYPARIYVPADAGDAWRVDWEDVAVGLWRYGVPVEALPTRAVDAARHLANRRAA